MDTALQAAATERRLTSSRNNLRAGITTASAIAGKRRKEGIYMSPTGIIVATYVRAGEVKTGSFALEKPTEAELERRIRLKKEE